MEPCGNGPTLNGIQPRRPRRRTRVANGKAIFAKHTADLRSPWVRRLRELFEDHLLDLGGHDVASTAERSICRRAAVLTVELELLEMKFSKRAEGAASRDLDLYSR